MTKILGLIVLTVFTLTLLSCSDGRHAPRSPFGDLGGSADASVVASKMKCVDVRDYEDLTAADIDNSVDEVVPPPAVETVPAEDEGPVAPPYQHPSQGLTGGNVTTQNNVTQKVVYIPNVPIVMPSLEVIQALNGIDPAEFQAETEDQKATEEIQECIENKIEQLEDCGSNCEFYWGAGQWLMTSERFYKKPKDSEIDIVKFKNCGQVKSSECLLTN